MFQTPQEAARMAIEAKVQVLGVSSLAAGHKTLLPQLTDELKIRNSHISLFAAAWCRGRINDFLRAHMASPLYLGPRHQSGRSRNEGLGIMHGQLRNS